MSRQSNHLCILSLQTKTIDILYREPFVADHLGSIRDVPSRLGSRWQSRDFSNLLISCHILHREIRKNNHNNLRSSRYPSYDFY